MEDWILGFSACYSSFDRHELDSTNVNSKPPAKEDFIHEQLQEPSLILMILFVLVAILKYPRHGKAQLFPKKLQMMMNFDCLRTHD